jgi:hypothetical protein
MVAPRGRGGMAVVVAGRNGQAGCIRRPDSDE